MRCRAGFSLLVLMISADIRHVLTLTSSRTWFEHVSMLVILLNCVTLGMFQPCEDVTCLSEWCRILQVSMTLAHCELTHGKTLFFSHHDALACPSCEHTSPCMLAFFMDSNGNKQQAVCEFMVAYGIEKSISLIYLDDIGAITHNIVNPPAALRGQ